MATTHTLPSPSASRPRGPVYPNWYRVLDLSPSSTLTDQDVRNAYQAQTAICVPERYPIGTPERNRADVYLRVIRQAYETLRNRESRIRYDFLRERVASEKVKYPIFPVDHDHDHHSQTNHSNSHHHQVPKDRPRVMAEGWLERIESETRLEEEQLTAILAKNRLEDFSKTISDLRSQHPSLPRPSREQVQLFFKAESDRRNSQREKDRLAHLIALEHLIKAEFKRREEGMSDQERRVRWKKGRDVYMKMSQQRKIEDVKKGQRDWELARDEFLDRLLRNHQHDHLCTSSTSSNHHHTSRIRSPVSVETVEEDKGKSNKTL